MNIYITLDYELFLGDNTGTPENCLIRPMNALCNAIDKYGVKLIVFVDAAYLLRMYQLKNKHRQIKKDYDLVTSHIKKMKSEGHDIQLHFHPQWLYSNWDEKENRWILDFNHYKLSDMDTGFAFKLFAEAKTLLDSIIKGKTYAFRAGGYSLETFSDYIVLLKDNELKIDSSVSRGLKRKSNFAVYDYMKFPNRTVYRFKDNFKIENNKGEFLELSIFSCKWNPVYYFTSIRPIMLNYQPDIIYGDGVGIYKKPKHNYLEKIKKLFKLKTIQASVDGPTSNIIYEIYNIALSKNTKDLLFIGHPKNFSDKSIKNIECFINKTFKKCNYQTTVNLLKRWNENK